MAVRVAINGFGRIGRLILRAIHERQSKDIKVVGINDLGPIESNAYLLQHDSVHGRFPGRVRVTKNGLNTGAGNILVTAERNPERLPWRKLDVDLALECTGIFASKEKASAHLRAGAKRVLISAPANDVDLTVVYGVNHRDIRKSHKIISNASCTTNCLAPVASVLNKTVGIEHGYMTTVHSYTGDQPVLDTLHSDPRRARAAGMSMIPTSTGAARAVGLVLPELSGKLDGSAIRVPTPNVSMIDLKFRSKRKTSVEEINLAIRRAASAKLKGILVAIEDPLVSIDFVHNSASSCFDCSQTQVIEGRFVRILSWYDNEWGFSNRMTDTALVMGKYQ